MSKKIEHSAKKPGKSVSSGKSKPIVRLTDKKKMLLIPSDVIGTIPRNPDNAEYFTIEETFHWQDLFYDRLSSSDPWAYQREFLISESKGIHRNFNIAAEQIPLVSRRKGTGVLYVINGQHTIGAKVIGGETMIVVRLITVETTQDEERILYNRCNDIKRATAVTNRVKNWYNSGVPVIVNPDNVLTANGFTAKWSHGPAKPNTFKCINKIQSIYNIDGGAHLNNILDFMNETWLTNEVDRATNYPSCTHSGFLTGLSNFFLNYSDDLDIHVNRKWFSDKCKSKSPSKIILDANTCFDKYDGVFKSIYNKNKKSNRLI